MDWDKLRIFHNVAGAGSFTHAGDVLHLSQSAVSRQIRGLEEDLNVVLFHRHARGFVLTEQGELLFQTTTRMSKHLGAASARIRDNKDEVNGTLKVTTTTGFGTLWLVPRLSKFCAKYPDLNIDLRLEERLLDLPMREADVAIRMKEPRQADLVRKRLRSVHIRLYASPAYLEKHGVPEEVEDLRKMCLLCQSHETPQVIAGAVMVKNLLAYGLPHVLYINSYYGVLQGVIRDLGVGVLPHYVTSVFSDFVRVLPKLQSEKVPVYLAYPEELRHSRRVQVFCNFVQEEINATRQAENVLSGATEST